MSEGPGSEFPLATPVRRKRWNGLRAEPLVGELGQAADSVPIATGESDRSWADAAPELDELDLCELAAGVERRHGAQLGAMLELEIELEADLPVVLGDGAILTELTDRVFWRAVEGIGSGWGTITIWVGVLGTGVGPIFSGGLRRSLPAGHYAFLEVHDTGGVSSRTTAAEVTEPFHCTHYYSRDSQGSQRVISYATAEMLVSAQGGALRMRSFRATGTSVVLLFPFASEPTGWFPE